VAPPPPLDNGMENMRVDMEATTGQAFKTLRADVTMNNGVFKRDNIALTAENLKMQARGVVDLHKKKVWFDINSRVPGIPVINHRLKGPFDNIKIKLKKANLARNTAYEILAAPMKVGQGLLNLGLGTLKMLFQSIRQAAEAGQPPE